MIHQWKFNLNNNSFRIKNTVENECLLNVVHYDKNICIIAANHDCTKTFLQITFLVDLAF